MSAVETVSHFHMCGGVGSGAAGFNDADPSIGTVRGRMQCVGGIDVSEAACRDFQMLTGVKQACLDLFTVGMYQAFHGRLPPPGWREVTAADVRAAAHGHFPDIVFASYPCKGFSGLLAAALSTTTKYVALNELTLRGVWLTMEAFGDDPPGLLIFENVPRISTRGRYLLNQIADVMRHYGYVGSETVHDCGEIGDGLGQSRKRFLMVFRHVKKVPPFLYEPQKRRLHAVGDILRHMPMPGDLAAGPMHRIPALQWKTWVRLAFVEAGSDWRSLNKLAVEDGTLRDYLVVPSYHHGFLGVRAWDQPAGTVAGHSGPTNGAFSVADPRESEGRHANVLRVTDWAQPGGTVTGNFKASSGGGVADPRFEVSSKWNGGAALGVRKWGQPTGTIAGQQGPLQGAYSVADPRHTGPAKHSNEFRIVAWQKSAQAVTSAHGSGQAVADPRPAGPAFAKYGVTPFGEPSRTVIAGSTTGEGAFAVADPRPGLQRKPGDDYLTGGHYGVVPWHQHSGAVSASACLDNGRWTVADPRPDPIAPDFSAPAMPAAADKVVCRIQSLDGTWHRPFTTLELAALQSLIDPEEWFSPDGPGGRGEQFVLDGDSDQRWREGIGNAVPRKAAKAIGTIMGQTILLARSGETFLLGSTPIWVSPLRVALSVAQEGAL